MREKQERPLPCLPVYVGFICLSYGLHALVVHPTLGAVDGHRVADLFGDLCALSWLGVSFACLPWHDFRATSSHVFIWWTGMVFFGIMYIMVPMTAGGAFQYSFASLTEGRLTSAQLRAFWLLVFTPLVLLAVYWARKFHTMSPARRNVFGNLCVAVFAIWLVSYLTCLGVCEYHPHHWWVGFCLVLLSTPTLDTAFDYLLQGFFWALIVDGVVMYDVEITQFFL
jgi:hypothetical protein